MQIHLQQWKESGVQDAWAVTIRVVPAFALAFAGGVISSLFAVSHERLCRMISLAAGTLLGVTLFSIVPESYETLRLWRLAASLATGYAVFYLISRYVFHVCPACAASHFDDVTTHRFGEIAAAMVIALGVHSTMDGLALAVGREAGMSPGLDSSMLLAICVHKVPEGLALCALLLAAGYRRSIALMWVAVVEATTLLGGAIGLWFFPRVSSLWLHFLLAHVGGGFVFLALHAVLGELVRHGRKQVLLHFFTGMALIAVLTLFFVHRH
jgi:ZIP family zinc transporter